MEISTEFRRLFDTVAKLLRHKNIPSVEQNFIKKIL
jgi:hypothetical protein